MLHLKYTQTFWIRNQVFNKMNYINYTHIASWAYWRQLRNEIIKYGYSTIDAHVARTRAHCVGEFSNEDTEKPKNSKNKQNSFEQLKSLTHFLSILCLSTRWTKFRWTTFLRDPNRQRYVHCRTIECVFFSAFVILRTSKLRANNTLMFVTKCQANEIQSNHVNFMHIYL